jgi:hypothetical protein
MNFFTPRILAEDPILVKVFRHFPAKKISFFSLSIYGKLAPLQRRNDDNLN